MNLSERTPNELLDIRMNLVFLLKMPRAQRRSLVGSVPREKIERDIADIESVLEELLDFAKREGLVG
jgi:hypothetical protein